VYVTAVALRARTKTTLAATIATSAIKAAIVRHDLSRRKDIRGTARRGRRALAGGFIVRSITLLPTLRRSGGW